MSTPLLEIQHLSKQFGALRAVHDVSLTFAPGEVHAVIGPNGAGKTTLINLLSGHLPPSNGQIHYRSNDITRLGPDRVSQLGIGRSFQKTNIFPNFTCRENCWIAAQSRERSSMRFFRPASRLRQVETRALDALARCGLGARADTVAAAMSYGEQRQLEIGMMLATEPDLLLLDEPLAGMGSEESQQVVALLRELATRHTLILIEHDMDAVFAIADRISVMDNGGLLATGTTEEIRNSAEVQRAYLGDDDEEAA